MPTNNPRVNVTLSPSLDALVGDLAKLQRVSKATVLRELLEAAEPTLAQAVAMMKAGNALSIEARAKVARDLAGSLQNAEAGAAQMMEIAAGITSDLVAQAEAIKGRRPAKRASGSAAAAGRAAIARSRQLAAKRGKTPLTSNRGVK